MAGTHSASKKQLYLPALACGEMSRLRGLRLGKASRRLLHPGFTRSTTSPVIDFAPSEDDRLILDAVAGVADRHGARAAKWDEEDHVDPEAMEALAEMGLGTVLLSEDGGGIGVALGCRVVERLAERSGGWALRFGAHAVAAALAEAAGLDGARLEALSADVGGLAWASVDAAGTARWVGGGQHAAHVLAVSEGGEVRLLDGAKLTLEPVSGLGMKGAGFAHLEGVEGGAVGQLEASGLERVQELARLVTAAIGVGVGRAALREATRYALDRKQFGRPISDFQAIQWMLADAATEVDAAGLLVVRGGLALDGRAPEVGPLPGAAALLLAAEAALGAAQKAIQIHGGYGFVREYPVERFARDARYLGVALEGRDPLRTRLGRALLEG